MTLMIKINGTIIQIQLLNSGTSAIVQKFTIVDFTIVHSCCTKEYNSMQYWLSSVLLDIVNW